MITIRLMGGLGNQMFQYALGRRLVHENDVPLALDLSWFASQEKRQFELDQWQISDTYNIKIMNRLETKLKSYHYFNRVTNFLKKNIQPGRYWYLKEQSPGCFDRRILNCRKFCILEGYWQSEKYFSPIVDALRQTFIPINSLPKPDQTILKQITKDPLSVCMHVRRGDYTSDYSTMAVHYICTPDYYREAYTAMREKLGQEPNVYLFSDEPDWCLKEFKDEWPNITIISNRCRSSVHEMYLMSQCKHHIIPNSSFSWWSAWLCDHLQKIVIAPARWLNNHQTPDLVPEHWKKIKHNDKNDWKYIDIPYAKKRYNLTFGRTLNLDQPKSFTEKLQWLKIYYRKPIMTTWADKISARELVQEILGKKYLTTVFGIFENADEIDFNNLPQKFIFKTNHGSEWNIVCNNKNQLNLTKTKKLLSEWLSKNYYYLGREWVYKGIKPAILCEELLDFSESTSSFMDYKIFCFHGKAKIIQAGLVKSIPHGYFDLQWKEIPIDDSYQKWPGSIQKPINLSDLITIAEKLSDGFPFVRVDLYNNNKKIYFGEMTFHPANGFKIFLSYDIDLGLGNLINLPIENHGPKN